MQADQHFQLGNISKLYSFKGEVILFIDADDPSKYYRLEHVLININNQFIPYFIEKSQVHKKNQLKVKFEGINTENEATSIVKKNVFLPLNSLPKLNDQQFYFHEIKDYLVFNAETNKSIGHITAVINHPGNLLLEIDVNEQEVILPLNDNTFHKIDKSKKDIYLFIADGLIDIYLNNE